MKIEAKKFLLISIIFLGESGIAGNADGIFQNGFEAGILQDKDFRITELVLADPHVFGTFIGCADLTNDLNIQIDNDLNSDDQPDGFLDLSLILGMRPLDQSGAIAGMEFIAADCTVPAEGTSCQPTAVDPLLAVTSYQSSSTEMCLDTLPGTTTGYVPAPNLVSAPCFASFPTNMTVTISGLVLPLRDVQMGATFQGIPTDQLTSGLLFGFLTEEDADSILLPDSIPFVGGLPLSEVLPGGKGNCSGGDDRDSYLKQVGWWLYFNFEAQEVPFTPL